MDIRFKQSRILFLASAAIVAAVIAAYEPMRHNGFVTYDDPKYVTENPIIKSGITRQTPGLIFKPHYFMWHPLTTFTNMLNCELFGLNPFWHHFVSLLFHIINAILLLWLLTKLTGSTWASAFAAAVFALHPVQVESVAWASELKTVLSGLFSFLTIAVYVWYTKRPNVRRYITLFLAYGLCIMTKPSVVVLPLALLLLDYWPLGRFDGLKQVKRLLIEKLPLLGLSAFLGMMTVIAQKSGGVVVALEKIPLDNRIANMFVSYIRYIGKMIWPSELAVIYPYRYLNFSKPAVMFCLILFVLITVVCIYIGLRKKYAATGWLWFVGTLVPMIGLIQAGSQSMANRYMYISMLGLLIIVAWAVKDLVDNRHQWKVFAAVLAGVILFSSVVLTRMQVGHWRNTTTLFDYALKVTKNNAIAENSYGCALFYDSHFNEAVQHFRKAIQLNPTYFEPCNNLGKVYLRQGKPKEAIECFNEVLRIRPDEAEAYANLGIAYAQSGNNEQAIQNWTRAIQLNPDNAEVLNNMAWILVTIGDVSSENVARAIELAQHACELTRYKEPDPLDTLAVAYAAAGRFNEAITTARKAVDAAKAESKEDLAGEIQNRIKLYQAGQRYRQK